MGVRGLGSRVEGLGFRVQGSGSCNVSSLAMLVVKTMAQQPNNPVSLCPSLLVCSRPSVIFAFVLVEFPSSLHNVF